MQHDSPGLEVLHRWAEALAARDLDGMAALFAPDAVFIGLSGPVIGPEAVRAYYDRAPKGLRAQVSDVLCHPQSGGWAVVATICFLVPDHPDLSGRLSLAGAAKLIRLYHFAPSL